MTTPKSSKTRRARARAATPAEGDDPRDRLIDATLRLLLVRPVAGVSVRDIAAEAGVNHGLVHRHFGSKDGLIRAAVKRAASVVYTDETPPRTRWFYDRLREHPELAILVARACLDGPSELLAIAAPPPALLEQLADRITPALRRLGMRPGDAHVVNALVTSALLGWFVFRPMLEAGYKLPARADDSLAQTIALLDHLLDANSASPR